jgi:dihydrofolate reductase
LRRIEGYAIVSADGMIADAKGEIPDTIRNDADQRYLQESLDRAAILVHGRHSAEGGPRAGRRKRLIVTRQTAALARDPLQPNALLWNPLGATLEEALNQSGATDGIVAIIGGPEVFSQFLPLYDAFHLSRAANATIPGGLPIFTAVGPHVTPDDVLARHGLRPGPRHDLDVASAVSVVTWER